MVQGKIKSYIESISSIRFLGVKDYVIIDANENLANIVLLRASTNPLQVFKNSKHPKHKILSQRECETTEDNLFELNREIKILSEKHKLKNAVLVLLINKYKHFNISLQKEASDIDEENNIEDLIRKQLPSNLNSSEFILYFEKTSEDESVDNYLVTITRKTDIERYFDIINNEAFQLRFTLPSIFALIDQKIDEIIVHNLFDFQQEKFTHYHQNINNRVTQDEYFIDPDRSYKDSVTEKIGEILSVIKLNEEDEETKPSNIYCHSPLKLVPDISDSILRINAEREINICYESSQCFKHILAYKSLFNDRILNFRTEKYIQSKHSIDIEKVIVTKFLFGTFSILFFLMVLLYGVNQLINSNDSEISTQNQIREKLELQVKQISAGNEQLKSDIQILNQIKYKREKISGLLKIISASAIDNLTLTDLKIRKNNANKYIVNLNGECISKDEVIDYIRVLESNLELNNIELIWLDKKRVQSYQAQSSNYNFQFSINLIFDEDQNSKI